MSAPDIIIINDDLSRMEVFERGNMVFLDVTDQYDYRACIAFTRQKIEILIDTLVAMKENMD